MQTRMKLVIKEREHFDRNPWTSFWELSGKYLAGCGDLEGWGERWGEKPSMVGLYLGCWLFRDCIWAAGCLRVCIWTAGCLGSVFGLLLDHLRGDAGSRL